MRMELTDNGCLKILLSEEDLEGLGLTFERLDYDDPATRDAMKLLLAAAQRETGFDPLWRRCRWTRVVCCCSPPRRASARCA